MNSKPSRLIRTLYKLLFLKHVLSYWINEQFKLYVMEIIIQIVKLINRC